MAILGQSANQFIVEQQRAFPSASGDLSGLLADVVRACKKIAHWVGRSGIVGLGGSADSLNVQGETQKRLDILAHQEMVDHLLWTGHLAAMASEEMEAIIPIPDHYPKGKYLLAFDPLDGSSNIDVNFSVGTIFSVWRTPEGIVTPTLRDFLQPGSAQVCAGFCVYGPSTMLILTLGNGVYGFTLDRDVGEFILTHPELTIPATCSEFAINASNQRHWSAPIQRYIEECLAGADGPRARNFNMRWNASMVAEVLRILVRGGVFLYPGDARPGYDQGKLRLLYEANPMSLIIEQAGGISTTGHERILDLSPDSVHQRVPVILGSREEVARILSYHAN